VKFRGRNVVDQNFRIDATTVLVGKAQNAIDEFADGEESADHVNAPILSERGRKREAHEARFTFGDDIDNRPGFWLQLTALDDANASGSFGDEDTIDGSKGD
jgi:hypothetical protein